MNKAKLYIGREIFGEGIFEQIERYQLAINERKIQNMEFIYLGNKSIELPELALPIGNYLFDIRIPFNHISIENGVILRGLELDEVKKFENEKVRGFYNRIKDNLNNRLLMY